MALNTDSLKKKVNTTSHSSWQFSKELQVQCLLRRNTWHCQNLAFIIIVIIIIITIITTTATTTIIIIIIIIIIITVSPAQPPQSSSLYYNNNNVSYLLIYHHHHYICCRYMLKVKIKFTLNKINFFNQKCNVPQENSQHFAISPTVSLRNDVWKTSAEILYWWHVTNHFWVVPLIGCAVWEICFNQSEALPRSG